MHTVMGTFKLPSGTAREQVVETIKATASGYQGVPGLIRKYYGLTEDGAALVGIYLWRSRGAADAFYTDDWIARVSGRWQSKAVRQDWETPMVVESAEHRLIASRRSESIHLCELPSKPWARRPY
jgi:DNA-binding PadR family transcriptional regulator